jgi:hypothetical protein
LSFSQKYFSNTVSDCSSVVFPFPDCAIEVVFDPSWEAVVHLVVRLVPTVLVAAAPHDLDQIRAEEDLHREEEELDLLLVQNHRAEAILVPSLEVLLPWMDQISPA